MAKILEQCPSCQSRMEITQLSCTNCETVVLGRFEPNRFSQLPPKSLAFLESFVRSRGNVKEMARETGISYWTIRKQLDELLVELDLEPGSEAPTGKANRREILARLKAGEIDAEEAARLLENP
ncbi:MAG TPA: DUF2089 domain-containing protein [Anaerolineales bacterium]|nr:DUF2089 domain-containing protein [Anaerolineales bacterium]